MDIIVYSYLPSIIGLTILGYLVYQNNPTATSNRLLGLLSATLAAWLLALMLSDTASSESTASVWLNIALGVGTPVGTVFLLFSNYFPYKSVSFSKVMLMIIAFINAVFIAAATAGLLITGVSLDSSGVNIEAASVLYSLQSLFVIGQVLASLWLLVRKRGRASIRQKAQIRMVFYGIASILTVNGIVGLILLGQDIPSALNALLTGASALIFISFISTAIIRHGMFDIRRTISRLLAHTFSVVFIVSAVSFVSSQIINTRISNDRERTLAIGLVVALSITVFPYVKRLFDSLSLKLFYQSAYVTRDVLAELSQELVKEIEIQTTLNNGLHVLGEALKPKSIHSYIVMSGQNLVQKARFGSAPKLPNKIITLLQEIREPQIVDLMEETEVKLALIRNGIEIVSVIENQGNIIGYLLYGHKSSGSVYTRQDLQLINTAGNNIGVAITNSLNFAEIQEFNTRLASEVKEATKQLRKTNRALEQSDQAKSDLISMASHQLRPQITASKGFVGMLIVDKDVKLKKSQQELLDYAHEGLGRMSSIVVDMLDMSKIDGGTLTIDYGDVEINIRKMIEDELVSLGRRLKAKDIKVDYSYPSKDPYSMLDSIKIREVISNFISNAMQYSPSGSTLKIKLTATSKRFKVTVKDQGIGVSKKDQKHIFEKFKRADNAKDIRPTGTGLGLYIAKKILEAHKGKVIFSSTLGKGSTFGLEMPIVHSEKSK